MDTNAFVEKSLFAKSFRQLFKTIDGRLKNARVGTKSDLGTSFCGGSRLFQGPNRNTGLKFHLVRLAVTPDLKSQIFAQKIDATDTNAV